MTPRSGSRTKRSTQHVITGALVTGLTLALGFIATPLLLRWLGEERFGAVRALSEWLAYLPLLELGLGGALLAALAKRLGVEDVEGVEAAVSLGIRLYCLVALAAACVGLALIPLVARGIPVAPEVMADLRTAWLVGLAGLLTLPLHPYRALAEARQRGFVVNVALGAQALAAVGGSLLLAWAGWGITGQLVAVVLSGWIFGLILFADGARRGVRPRRPKPGARHAELVSEIRSQNRPMLALSLGGRVSVLSDNIIVAAILGPAAVVPFFLTRRLATVLQGQLQSVGNASWAGLAEIYHRGDRERFNQRLVELTGLVAALGMAVLIPVALFNEGFISAWVGSRHYGGNTLTLLAAANAFFLGLFSLWAWCFTGTGHVRLLVPLTLAQTGANVLASVGLTYAVGITGPLLGSLVGYLGVSLWWLPRLLNRTFDVSLPDLWQALLRPVVLGVLYVVPVRWLFSTTPPQGWLALLPSMAGTGAAYLALWWVIVLGREERRLWLDRFSGVVGRPGRVRAAPASVP